MDNKTPAGIGGWDVPMPASPPVPAFSPPKPQLLRICSHCKFYNDKGMPPGIGLCCHGPVPAGKGIWRVPEVSWCDDCGRFAMFDQGRGQ